MLRRAVDRVGSASRPRRRVGPSRRVGLDGQRAVRRRSARDRRRGGCGNRSDSRAQTRWTTCSPCTAYRFPTPANDEVARAVVPLSGLREYRSDTPAALDEAAAAASLTPMEPPGYRRSAMAHSPNAVADGIDQRLWSYLWTVDEPTWDAVVAPVVAALRALPEPDRPRSYKLSSHLAVFARQPGA